MKSNSKNHTQLAVTILPSTHEKIDVCDMEERHLRCAEPLKGPLGNERKMNCDK